MNWIVAFLLGILNAMLINNVTLSRFYGICPFLGVSKKSSAALGMGAAVVIVILIASLICWPIYYFILVPAGIPFMDTITYILVIASIVQLIEMIIKKYSPSLYKALGVYLPLITTNCAVLGIALTNVQNYSLNETFNIAQKLGASVVSGLGTAIGFTIAIVIMAGIRERIEYNDVPESFKGMPIVLLTAGLMAIAFFGFSGII